MTSKWVIALHGGAGVTPGRDYSAVERHMEELVTQAGARLDAGLSALDAVEWAVTQLEASGFYTAGRGSAPNRAGQVEFDACIMDGPGRRAGAVAAIRDVQSPIQAARAVMERTPHLLLVGDGATAFARETGLPAIGDDPDYFRLAIGVEPQDLNAPADALGHGTVGAVALDRQGRLAAATSTGGLFGKRPGRVGDTPLPGGGTWADDLVAISCTGVGEHFIRAGGAHDVAARHRYLGQSLHAASDALLAAVKGFGGNGGLIAVGRDALPVFAWNSPGLKRAANGSDLPRFVAI
jgi:L-asparaginase/beta-aspartyl-peptidase (threonine type)